MRIARQYPERPADAPDPRVTRDQLYSELRNIGEIAEKLSHRARLVAAKLATLPLADVQREIK